MRKVPQSLFVRRERNFVLGMLSPTIVMLVALTGFPILYSFALGFTDYIISRGGSGRFVGLANYAELFANSVFVASLWKTAYFSLTFLAATLVIGLFVALLLNQDFRGKGFVITCLLIPWAIPKVVSALIWKWIYDGNFGVFNAILVGLGLAREYRFYFAESPLIGILLIAMADTWKMMPFVALMFLAALQTIPRELQDAARVDGAGVLQRFLSITIPQLRYSFIVVLILQTTSAIKLFDMIAVLTQGGPGDRTMVTYYYIFRTGFEYLKIGSASAGAYVVTLFILAMALLYYRLLKGSEE